MSRSLTLVLMAFLHVPLYAEDKSESAKLKEKLVGTWKPTKKNGKELKGNGLEYWEYGKENSCILWRVDGDHEKGDIGKYSFDADKLKMEIPGGFQEVVLYEFEAEKISDDELVLTVRSKNQSIEFHREKPKPERKKDPKRVEKILGSWQLIKTDGNLKEEYGAFEFFKDESFKETNEIQTFSAKTPPKVSYDHEKGTYECSEDVVVLEKRTARRLERMSFHFEKIEDERMFVWATSEGKKHSAEFKRVKEVRPSEPKKNID